MRKIVKLQKIKRSQRFLRKKRTRAKVKGTRERPRLSVFRSLKHIYAQLIDDEKGETLISANDSELPKKYKMSKKVDIAQEIGRLIAKKALVQKINKVVFDRGGFKYHGRMKALAEGARKGGLKF